MEILHRGIDVSKYQGIIDWNKVKAAGYKFAFIRVGWCNYDGTITEGFDPYFTANMTNAIAAGINVGVYVYSYAKTTDAARICAREVLKRVKPYKLTMPIAWDYEDSKLYASFGKQANVNICKAFLDTINENKYYGMLYTYTSFANAYLDMSQLTVYDMWIADYRASCGYKGKYSIWQYSSSGSVPGVNGRCDVNYEYTDHVAIIEGAGLNGNEQKENVMETLNNKLLKVNEVNGRNPNQYFSTTNTDNDLGYIDVGEYKAVEKLSAAENGFWWVKFVYTDGKEYWAVYDNGSGVITDKRAVLIDGVITDENPVVPPINDTTLDDLMSTIERLKLQVKEALESKKQLEEDMSVMASKYNIIVNENTALKTKIDSIKKEAQDVINVIG